MATAAVDAVKNPEGASSSAGTHLGNLNAKVPVLPAPAGTIGERIEQLLKWKTGFQGHMQTTFQSGGNTFETPCKHAEQHARQHLKASSHARDGAHGDVFEHNDHSKALVAYCSRAVPNLMSNPPDDIANQINQFDHLNTASQLANCFHSFHMEFRTETTGLPLFISFDKVWKLNVSDP